MKQKKIRKIRPTKKSEQGFTLIEVLVTAGIAAVVIGGFIGANVAIQKKVEASFQESVAIEDAHRVIEQMRNVAATGVFPGNVVAAFPNNAAVAGFGNLINETLVVNYAAVGADPLDVTVTVTWLKNGQRNTTRTLRTWITQR